MSHSQVMVKMVETETLTSRCLRNIANNFRTLNIDKLDQLPKSLRNVLLRFISKRGYIDDENIHVFLHEGIKVLEFNDCLKLTDRGIDKLTICRNLVKLDLNSNNVKRSSISSKAIINLSRSCQFLRIILLRRCVSIDDACIEALSINCKLLTSLNIGDCPLITDKSLIVLGQNCNHLTSINISGTKITDNGIFMFMTKNITMTLEEVHMAHCDFITDQSIECILHDSKLIKYLMFHGCKKTTGESRMILEEYMSNNSNQKVKNLTWTIY